ncbi:TonB-dependent receptor [Novosphingobium sp. KACC 22771]|uniref:TonB-dependent receptor n=1 Tax=Novosphingobium sp. KACC 22771 TaxID=3025670 RepID=UPI002366BEE4|nr:TonB-dependent receptor [Novosphingobium sp. KACC 22771]WDF74752.1 TonB-dependent receptor [Novosphingobium sp. KACC 22771]
MKKNVFAGVASAMALAVATQAYAQTTQVTPDGDIIVTATRTETLLSKTPIAMTAVSGDQLVQKGITNTTQLADSVPNVSIVRGNGLQITIRGVTSTDGTEKGDPSAAFLLDGIYIARPQAQEVSFFDVDRVEVLRGPQGTLYGRNTTAGVVNVLTAAPKFKLGASGDIAYESYNHVTATGVINAPVSDTLALRAAVNYDRRDTYVNKTSNDPYSWGPFKDVFAARLSALWQPTTNFKVLVRGDYSLDKGYGVNAVPTTNFFTSAAAASTPGVALNADYRNNTNSLAQRSSNFPEQWQGQNHNVGKGVMGQADWNISDALTLTYLGSYRTLDRWSHGTTAASSTAGSRNTFTGKYWQTSHEARLAFKSGGLFVQAGGYYFKEKSGIAFFILDPGIGIPSLAPFAQFGFPQDPTIAVSKGVFGQASYNFTDRLKLTGGVRYSSDDKSRVGATVADLPNGTRVTFQNNNASRNFSKTTWRVGVDYDVPGLGLFYGSVATGYKAGGFNDGCETGKGPGCALPGSALYYQPETLTSYEAGFKIHTKDNVLRVNGNYFHYDYNGLQVSSVQNVCGGPCQVTANAASATVDGVELETTLRPAKNHTIDATVTFLDAHYNNYTPPIAGANANFAGVQLNRSPKSVVSLGYTYNQPLGNGGEITFNARTRISASYALTDIGNGVFYRQPNYTKSELALTYNAPNKAYYVGVFGKNLENRIVLTSVTANGSFAGTAVFEDPRTFGIRAGVKF